MTQISKTPLQVKQALGGEISEGLGLVGAETPYRKAVYLLTLGTGTTVTSAVNIEGEDLYTVTKTDAYIQVVRTDEEDLGNNVLLLNGQNGVISAANPGLTSQMAYTASAAAARLTNAVLTASEYEAGNFLAGVFLLTIYEEVEEA